MEEEEEKDISSRHSDKKIRNKSGLVNSPRCKNKALRFMQEVQDKIRMQNIENKKYRGM